jgi:hypothetical protein
MPSLAIPPVTTRWRYLPRPLYASWRCFDWSPLMPWTDRPAVDWALRLRVLSLGFDITWNQCARYYGVSIGSRWLLNIAAGKRFDTSEDGRRLAGNMFSPTIYGANRYVEITLFLFASAFGQDADQPWRLRYFFNGRRIFHGR